MRILFALILTHFFSCIIAEDSDDSANANGRRMRYDLGAVEGQSTGTENLTNLMDTLAADQKLASYPRTSSFQRAGFIDLLPEPSAFVDTQSAREKLRKPLRMRLRRILAEQRECYSHDGKTIRKIGDHLHGKYTPCHELVNKEQKDLGTLEVERVAREDDWEDDDDDDNDDDDDHATEETEETETETETEPGEWDEWTVWSECSASCGCGRQVRWQHCVGKGCMTGLKKAQIRICHLRDCSNKNFLSWLGMKG